MPQFGASLNDDARAVIYDCNMFIIQAVGVSNMTTMLVCSEMLDYDGNVRLVKKNYHIEKFYDIASKILHETKVKQKNHFFSILASKVKRKF